MIPLKNGFTMVELSGAKEKWLNSPLSLSESEIKLLLSNSLGQEPIQYDISDKGISMWSGDEKNRTCHLLTDTLILPIKEIRQHRSGTITRKIMLLGMRKGQLLEPVTLTPAELTSMKWIREVWGFKVWISPILPNSNQYILDCIYQTNEFIPIVDEYCDLGWTKDQYGKDIYVTGSTIIGSTKINQSMIHDDLKNYSLDTPAIPEKDAFDFVLNTVFQMGPNTVTHTAVSFMILSLTTSALSNWAYKPDFVYYLHAQSGSRKTSLSKIFFNMYERYWDEVPINFTATQPAMEFMMHKMRDTVVLIDDIAPSVNASERFATEKKLEAIVRSYGDNAGRQKMGINNKAINMKPNGLAAITAEDAIFKNPSSMARCFMVQIDKEDVNIEKLSAAQNYRGIYPRAIMYFLEEISTAFGDYIEGLKKKFLQSKRYFSENKQEVHGRLIHTAAWLDAAFSAYLQYGEDRGFLTSEEANKLMRQNKSLLVQWINTQDLVLRKNNEVDMFVLALKQMITSNRIKIPKITLEGKRNTVLEAPEGIKLVGYRDFDKIFLLPDVAYAEVRSFYARQGLEYPISQRTLIDRLCKRGILLPDNNKDGTKTVRITVDGQRVSVIRLDQDQFRLWGDHEDLYY